MAPKRQHRFSFEPVEYLAVRRTGSAKAAAVLLGLHHRQWYALKDDGVTRDMAERLATALERHPFELWPEMVDIDIAAVTRTCESDECDETFILDTTPSGQRRRFCTDRCRR